MSGWLRYLELRAKAKTGLSSAVLAWAIAAALCGAVTSVFLLFAAYIWLAEHYSPLTAALILGAFFLLVTIIALIACLIVHGRTAERARQELATRSQAPWLDPRYLAVGLQVGRAVGLRRLVPVIAVGLVAAGLAKEWFGDDKAAGESREAGGSRVDERDAA